MEVSPDVPLLNRGIIFLRIYFLHLNVCIPLRRADFLLSRETGSSDTSTLFPHGDCQNVENVFSQ